MMVSAAALGSRLGSGVDIAGMALGFELLQVFLPEFVPMEAEIV
jgi:hypothetical protein